jgi:hypothetical protein
VPYNGGIVSFDDRRREGHEVRALGREPADTTADERDRAAAAALDELRHPAEAATAGLPSATLDVLIRQTGRLLESLMLHTALGLALPRRIPPPGAAAESGGLGTR